MGARKLAILVLGVLFLNINGALLSQGRLVVVDESDGSTLPSAHFCFQSLDKQKTSYALSDADGAVENNTDRPSIVSISYVGYTTKLDTIYPGISKKIVLSPSSVDVGEVIVTAQFSPKKVDQSIYKVKVISNSSIEKKGATNLSELISNELNFSPVRDAALGTSVRIQGLGGEHVKVLVDGVPVVGRQNGILDLSQINVASIDHIEIVEGPMSVVYGSNAMAGVINIITKENKRQSLSAGVKSYYESVGTYDFDANFSMNKGVNSFGLSAGRYYFGGFSEADSSRAKEWDPKMQYNLEGYYALNIKDYKVKLSSNYFQEELRDNGNLNPGLNYEGAFDYYHFTKRFDNKLELNKKYSGLQNLSITAAYSMYEKIKNKYLNDLVNLEKHIVPEIGENDTTVFNNYFSRGTYSNENLEKLAFQTGYELNYETATSERLVQQEEIGDLSGFLSINYLPLKQLSIQPGLRYIYNFKYDAPLVYSLNVKWDPAKLMSLRASYAKGFRAPSLKELYLDFKDINHNITGNPDLEAETGNNLNLWMDFKFGTGSHTFALANNMYYNKIDNKIELLYNPSDPTAAVYFNVPAGAVISRGFSSDLSYKLHPRLTMNAGVFHNQISSIVSTESFTRSTDYASSFKYKNVKYRFELSVFYKYTDRYSRYTGSIDMNTGELMDVQLSYLEVYHNMDATFSIPFMKSAAKFTCGVKNIFDNTTIASSGGGAVHSGGGSSESLLNYGRTWFVRLTYNFNKYFN